ncbi:MAG TPA: protein kinase [Gaiellaceae bacterium]|nr:protein kinase [Gaiellaceae bacterium]
MAAVPEDSPAHSLLGLELDRGWHVVRKVERAADATGSNFAVGYVVENGGQTAFLKALDFSSVFKRDNFMLALEELTTAFNFEREILERCAAGRMDRIVRVLGHGDVRLEGAAIPVSYLIFEQADGDVRKVLRADDRAEDAAWKLRVLHHAATGLRQMHSRDMAHQDLKPSNLLIFEGDSAKLGDLGRASQRSLVAPHDEYPFPGDAAYAPLEFYYGQVATDWAERRQAADLYMLGSLILFLFGEVHMTAAVLERLAESARPGVWRGDYSGVLQYVRVAFNGVLEELDEVLQSRVDDDVREGILGLVRHLCEPDPSKRGHPRARAVRHGNPYSLERFISELNVLAGRARVRRV